MDVEGVKNGWALNVGFQLVFWGRLVFCVPKSVLPHKLGVIPRLVPS